MDNMKISFLTLCDLPKAFGSASTNLVLRKCKELCVDSFWFDNYLRTRSQSVKLDKIVSNKELVKYGVLPQRSILGPILFTIYVNDLQFFLQDCLVIQYADDTQFLHAASFNDLDTPISKTEE